MAVIPNGMDHPAGRGWAGLVPGLMAKNILGRPGMGRRTA